MSLVHQVDETLELIEVLAVQQGWIEPQIRESIHVRLLAHDLVVGVPVVSRKRILASIWDTSIQGGRFGLLNQGLWDAGTRRRLLVVAHLQTREAECHIATRSEYLCNLSIAIPAVCVVVSSRDFGRVALVSIPPVDTRDFPCQFDSLIGPENRIRCGQHARTMTLQGFEIPIEEESSLVLLIDVIEECRRIWRVAVVVANDIPPER